MPTTPKRPRSYLRIAFGTVCIAALALLGSGLTERLAPTSILVPGSPSAEADAVLEREFGNSIPVTILLEGPARALDRQGPRLVAALRAEGEVEVMSPWSRFGAEPGVLRPRSDAALIVAGFRRPEAEAMSVVVPTAERLVADTIAPPVDAHVGGVAAIATALQENALEATHQAELIVAPILLVVLLLVFRTPVAAAIPLLIGAATVLAGRGLLLLATLVMPINALAVAIASMMGLALGVDYALLMVSRYRQERDAGTPIDAAVATAAHAAGRTIVFAGATLALAMVTAALVAPGDLLGSVAAGVAVSTVLSVVLAVSLMPGLIHLLAPHIERWKLPSLGRGPGLVGAAERLIARPWIAIPLIVLPIAAVAMPAHALSIGPPDPRQLPPDDPTGQGFEALRKAIGPGWAAPIVVSATAKEGPISSPGRLRAISRWERGVARDPAVAAVVGPTALAPAERAVQRARRAYDSAPRHLARAERGIGELRDGLGAAGRAVGELRAGLGDAATGAGTIAARTRDAQAGAARLERGLDRAQAGARRLAHGLDRARRAGRRLASGQARLSDGAGRLARGLRRLERTLTASLGELDGLLEQLRYWSQWLETLRAPTEELAEQLRDALAVLGELSAEPDDPRYAELLEALERAADLVGIRVPGGPPPNADGIESLVEAIEEIEEQLDQQLNALAALPKRLDRLVAGVRRLRRGGDRLAAGSRRAARGSAKLHEGLRELAKGGDRLAGGLEPAQGGARRLGTGLGAIAAGADHLAGELAGGRHRTGALADGLARADGPLGRYALTLQGYRDDYRRLDQRLPGAIDSGYLLLTGLDGTVPRVREQITQLVSLERGGRTVQMLIVPAAGPGSAATQELTHRLRDGLPELERKSGTEAEIGEGAQSLADYTEASLARLPWLVLALCTVSVAMLVMILRSLLLPLAAVALNLLTIGAAFGALQILFGFDLLVGPPYIDAISAAGVLTIMFVLAIDYEVFLLTRMREIWLETGDHARAVSEGLRHTAGVITGAAVIMSSVFLAFATAQIASLQQFGAGLTIAVALDATVVRLVLLPAIMRALGPRAWWLPTWLDRRLPVLDHGAPAAIDSAAPEVPEVPEPADAAPPERLHRIADDEHCELLELLAQAQGANDRREPERVHALVDEVRGLAEPHFRYEQRALFPRLVATLGADRVENLYVVQERALDALSRVAELSDSAAPDEAALAEAGELLGVARHSVMSCHELSEVIGGQPPEVAERVLAARREVLEAVG